MSQDLAEIKDEHCVHGLVDDLAKLVKQTRSISAGEIADKHRVLKRVAERLHHAVGMAKAPGVADVVADEVPAPHLSAGRERPVVGDLAGERLGKHARLEFDDAPV